MRNRTHRTCVIRYENIIDTKKREREGEGMTSWLILQNACRRPRTTYYSARIRVMSELHAPLIYADVILQKRIESLQLDAQINLAQFVTFERVYESTPLTFTVY